MIVLWESVTCDQSSHVIPLDINNKLIYGRLNGSTSLSNLQYLQSLNLSNHSCYFCQIPLELHKFVSLTYIKLYNAGISRQILHEISIIKRLATIDFSILYFPRVPALEPKSKGAFLEPQGV